MRSDYSIINQLISEAVTVLCRNGINYQKELRIEGVIGITVDKSDVFVVHINETFETHGLLHTQVEDDSVIQNQLPDLIKRSQLLKRRHQGDHIEKRVCATQCKKRYNSSMTSRSSLQNAKSPMKSPTSDQTHIRCHVKSESNGASNDSQYNLPHGAPEFNLGEVTVNVLPHIDDSEVTLGPSINLSQLELAPVIIEPLSCTGNNFMSSTQQPSKSSQEDVLTNIKQELPLSPDNPHSSHNVTSSSNSVDGEDGFITSESAAKQSVSTIVS